jgi:hypothetical protein
MDLAAFRDLLETLGADLAKWPPFEAEAARRLLATSEAAQDAFARATLDDISLLDPDEAVRARADAALEALAREDGDE